MKDLNKLVRPNILALTPYSSARDEYSGQKAKVFLDANESPFNAPYNRYPDPLQQQLKEALSKQTRIYPSCIFLGNGSDEAIDLVFRVFCIPQKDNVVAIEPTYGMYAVCAQVNDVEYRRVRLDDHFNFSAEKLLETANERTKAIFLCSPNNPTGNLLDTSEIIKTLESFDGIVVVDEAYIDFAESESLRFKIAEYPNLIVLSTLSKAWASANIRLGMAFARPEIVSLFNKVKYPYNVNGLTQRQALDILKRSLEVHKWTKTILDERDKVIVAFKQLPFCEQVYPTDANFFLAKVKGAKKIYDYLSSRGIIVRNRSQVTLCEDCLRITIGLPNENSELIGALRQYPQ